MSMQTTASGPPISLDLRIRGMGHSATTAINEHSNQLRAEGREVFKLGLGQSPFPVPDSVVQALVEHAGEKDYLPVRGLPALREAVAGYHRRRDGVACTGDDVLIAPGSKELLYQLQLVHYSDVLIPSPAWVSYAAQARLLGRRIERIPTDRAHRWALRPEALDAVCRADPERPRVLILNYPCNPTGYTLSKDELGALAEVARKYRIVLISDEIYGELDHAGQHVSMAKFYPEGTIISAGLSKWCGAGGWRLGTFVFPDNLSWLREAMTAVATETFTSTSAPIQYAAVRAYAGGADLDDYLARSRRILAALGKHVAGQLRSAGAHCDDPQGAFYLFPDFAARRESLRARGVDGGAAMCQKLLDDTGVAVLPGRAFGRPADELTCRMAYINFDGQLALERVGSVPADQALDEQFLRAVCPRVCQAIDRLCQWLAA